MLKGFREFLSRGNIIDLSVAVVIGTAFTALVTKFTDSVIQPLINRIGAGKDAEYGILRIDIGGEQTIDLNVVLSAAINFVLVAAVVYFLVVLPYKQAAQQGQGRGCRGRPDPAPRGDPRRPRREGHLPGPEVEPLRGHQRRIAVFSF